MKVLVTAGGTKVPIDTIRSITNVSKGTFGSHIAEKFLLNARGGDIIYFLRAKDSKMPSTGSLGTHAIFRSYSFETFWEYDQNLTALLDEKPDIIVLAAAVSDYDVVNRVSGKMRSKEDMTITLKPLPKLIAHVRKLCPDSIICGFKLLVNSTKEELLDAASASIIANRLNLVVANDWSTVRKDNHSLHMVEYLNGGIYTGEFSRADHDLATVVRDHCMSQYYKKVAK